MATKIKPRGIWFDGEWQVPLMQDDGPGEFYLHLPLCTDTHETKEGAIDAWNKAAGAPQVNIVDPEKVKFIRRHLESCLHSGFVKESIKQAELVWVALQKAGY